jgi:hypothetical protein
VTLQRVLSYVYNTKLTACAAGASVEAIELCCVVDWIQAQVCYADHMRNVCCVSDALLPMKGVSAANMPAKIPTDVTPFSLA